jgi:hypothetical protein
MFTLTTKGLTESVTLKNLPTVRQAFVVASGVIVASYALEYFVHPAFDYLPLLVAGGLLLAGSSGFCPLVYFLQCVQRKQGK